MEDWIAGLVLIIIGLFLSTVLFLVGDYVGEYNTHKEIEAVIINNPDMSGIDLLREFNKKEK